MPELGKPDAAISPMKFKPKNDPRVAIMEGVGTPDPRGILLTPSELKAKALFQIPDKPIIPTTPVENPAPAAAAEEPLTSSPVPGMSAAELAANANARLAATTIDADLARAKVTPGIIEKATEVLKPITNLIRHLTERRKLADKNTGKPEEEGPVLYRIPTQYL